MKESINLQTDATELGRLCRGLAHQILGTRRLTRRTGRWRKYPEEQNVLPTTCPPQKNLKDIYKSLTIKSSAPRKKRDGFEIMRRSDFKSKIQSPN